MENLLIDDDLWFYKTKYQRRRNFSKAIEGNTAVLAVDASEILDMLKQRKKNKALPTVKHVVSISPPSPGSVCMKKTKDTKKPSIVHTFPLSCDQLPSNTVLPNQMPALLQNTTLSESEFQSLKAKFLSFSVNLTKKADCKY